MSKLRFTIGRRIGAGFGAFIVLTLLAFIFTLLTLIDSRQKTKEVTEIFIPSVANLKEINSVVLRSKVLIINWVNIPIEDEPSKKELKDLIKKEYPALKQKTEDVSLNWKEEDKEQLHHIFQSVDDLFLLHKEIMDNLNSFSSYEEGSIVLGAQNSVMDATGDLYTKTESILSELNDLIIIQQANATGVNRRMIESFNLLERVVRILGIALVIGGIIIALLTVRSIVSPIRKLKKILQSMGRGVLPTETIRNRNDEIGEMSVALDGLIKGMRSTTDFAHEVGSANFQSAYTPLSEEDTLGHALLKMRSELAENERMLEQKVIERTEQVMMQKREIENQNERLEVLYKHVTDSIKYAKRIQEAILPPDNVVKKLLPDSFVLYKPKDIVSGDFYWIQKKQDKVLFATVDCTGHGVPGAFMSIVGHNLLKHVVTNTSLVEPALILDALNKGVSDTLHSSGDEVAAKDGMDVSLCSINFDKLELEYSGAYNPLYLLRDGALQEIKGDKFPVGFFVGEGERKFTNHNIKLQKGDMLYVFSDGYADQFGGPNGKKFMARNFRDVLLKIHNMTINDQKLFLDKTIETWKGTLEQVDDILVWGVKI